VLPDGFRWPLILLVGLVLAQASRMARAEKPRLEANRHEWSLVPAFSADSDRGYGFGALGVLARFKEGYDPYRWRAKLLIYMTVKPSPDGGAELAFHDHRLNMELLGLQDSRLRLSLDLRFARFTNSGYFGFGNAAKAQEDPGRFHQYDRYFPQGRLQARVKVLPRLQLLGGFVFTYSKINLYEGSLLEKDLSSQDSPLKELLRGAEDHGLPEATLGCAYDSRDHEFIPSRGMFHDITWRFAPASTAGTKHAYGGLNLTTRFYFTLVNDRLIAAARVLGDLLVGQPPFYELAWHGGIEPMEAIGGVYAIRGVPLHRYHGKVKLLGNLELRARLFPFVVFGQRFRLGGVLFFDAGRVWTELSGSPNEVVDGLGSPVDDGKGLGLKYGVGGGPRLQWGETFVIRADVAWSPDAEPIGFYLEHRHIF
jgi:outer membrane protein assembly factor BamA